MKTPLDLYDELPPAMVQYQKFYGWHFSKKAYEWAVSKMRSRDGKRVAPMAKDQFQDLMKRYGVELEHDEMYDALYVYSMAMSDYYGSSLQDEHHVALFVKDYIDDPDAPDGSVFAKWYACTVRGGTPIEWDELM